MDFLLLVWYFFGGLQLLFWGLIFQRLAWTAEKEPHTPKLLQKTSLPPVSVVICARNEAANLRKNLESILLQDYPNFELIVVNDDSEDETAKVLSKFKEQFAHLQVITICDKKNLGKKNALTKGIKSAQFDWILLTDADCKPASSHWILEMYRCTVDKKQAIVLGYGPYEPENTWLSRWVQFETIYVAIQYFSFASWKEPYMGVGRNLMYKKSLFEAIDGFKNHERLTSGDDDLFVNEVANGENTAICLHPNSYLYSPSPKSWTALYRQKTRHYSSSNHYKMKHKMMLGALSLSHFCFYLGIFIFIVGNVWNSAIFVILILRTFLVHQVFFKYLNVFNKRNILLYVGIFDVLVPVYYLVFASALLGDGQKKWK